MSFMNRIIGYLVDIGDFFYDAYLEVHDWVWPFWYLMYPLYDLHYAFIRLAWYFSDFAEWVDAVADQVRDILSWSNIRSLIRSWLPDLEDVIAWWDRWWVWVSQEIDDWWNYAKGEVEGWISAATQGFDNLAAAWDEFRAYTWPRWTDKLDLLAADWGNFFTHKLPTLFDISYAEEWWRSKFLDVTGAISSAFIEREDFWAGWQDFRDKVIDFFTDPVEFLWARFTDWFLGPEG